MALDDSTKEESASEETAPNDDDRTSPVFPTFSQEAEPTEPLAHCLEAQQEPEQNGDGHDQGKDVHQDSVAVNAQA